MAEEQRTKERMEQRREERKEQRREERKEQGRGESKGERREESFSLLTVCGVSQRIWWRMSCKNMYL